MRISRTRLLPRKEYVRDAKLCVIASEGTNTENQYLEGLFGSAKLKVEVLGTGSRVCRLLSMSLPASWILKRNMTSAKKMNAG